MDYNFQVYQGCADVVRECLWVQLTRNGRVRDEPSDGSVGIQPRKLVQKFGTRIKIVWVIVMEILELGQTTTTS